MEPPPAISSRITIFYDGACPLCSREIHHYLGIDKTGRLTAVDISSPDFDAVAEGLDARKVQEWLHVRTSDGSLRLGVDAFRAIWQILPGWGWLANLVGFPGIYHLSWWAYRLFAANRYRLTGRCSRETCELDSK